MKIFYNFIKNIFCRYNCCRSDKMLFGRKPKNCCVHLPSEKVENKDVFNNPSIVDNEKQKKIDEEKKLEAVENHLKCKDEVLKNDVETSSNSSLQYCRKKIKKYKKKNCLKFQGHLLKLINENQDMVDYRLNNIARRLDSLEETIRYEVENIKNSQQREEEWEKYLYKA